MTLEQFIQEAILEDTQDPLGLIPSGDHSALACIPLNAVKSAQLIIKQDGILAGVDIATKIFKQIDSKFEIKMNINDGQVVKKGDIVLYVKGNAQKLLLAERLVLNIMQRMSGIATTTNQYIELIKPYSTKILDTRKTTPNFRYFEKLAVKIGGGFNHRFGLYDMIMLKDNHIDYCGGIEQAINQTNDYKLKNQLNLRVEIETRNLEEVAKVIKTGKIDRIMFDNFSPAQCREAVIMINKEFETEASGGITKETINDYAATGVDFISVGALTHSSNSLDMSLKAI